MNISLEEHHLWAKVAKLYYEEDLTQNEIAEKLGFSRIKVHRILSAARDAGIVQVHIKPPEGAALDLENQLMRKFDLRDCVVVQDYPPQEDFYRALNQGAASWLKAHLQPGSRVGLGLGRTLSYLPDVFENTNGQEWTFTEIAGAISDHNWGLQGNNTASRLAEICGGKAELFYAPTLVSTPHLREQLIKEHSIQKSLERARSCDIVLQSVGPADETAMLYVHGYLSRQDLEALQAAGAVGDALGCYFDKGGRIIPSPTEMLMIGIHLSDLINFPWSLLVAGGPEKVPAIQGALAGDYFNVLITNTSTAHQLLAGEG
jgi:lsr operon transcriptional repressor